MTVPALHLLILHVLQFPVELFASFLKLLLCHNQLAHLHLTLVQRIAYLMLDTVSDSRESWAETV